jgi:regulator of protease activity HflC (stomatin/prohibitin superfamily)
MFKRIKVGKHQKAIIYEGDVPKKIYQEGSYSIFDPFNKYKIITHDLTKIKYEGSDAKHIEQYYPSISQHLKFVQTSNIEVAFIRRKQDLIDLIPPSSTFAYWSVYDIDVEIVDTTQDYICDLQYFGNSSRLKQNAINQGYIKVGYIEQSSIGLLYINGQFINILDSGAYSFWEFNNHVNVQKIDKRIQSSDINGQEILTKDKVTIRINLGINYQIIDPLKAVHDLANYSDYIYRQSQFALRKAVGIRTLDEMLSDKQTLNDELYQELENRFSEYGIELKGVDTRDIILPGEIREILNQVVEAEKSSRANVIKRQEETAATRSLLNTAKLMDDNPTLLRLKELESLEKITDKVNSINVYDGLQGILSELIKLRP